MLYMRKYKKQREKIKITSSVLQKKNMFVSCYSILVEVYNTEKGFYFFHKMYAMQFVLIIE